MKNQKLFILAVATCALYGVTACEVDNEPTAAEQPVAEAAKQVSADSDSGSPSPGKPTAPIDISYEVIGNAIIGLPVSINVIVKSNRGPVSVQYSITDSSALMFQTGQVERLEIADPSSGSVQQLAVIPQREGRVYVNVSAEIQSPDGLNIRSMAIPIKVGSAPEKATVNGELVEGPDGETVISMPAQESN